MSAAPKSPLTARIAALRQHYGRVTPPATTDPYQLLLLEQVAYLADDARRRHAFERLSSEVGLDPDAILRAKQERLESITKAGGPIAFDKRAERLREVARRTRDDWKGDLRAVLSLPFVEARRALVKFPAIGEPGAEKILLLCGAYPALALDSNGLRVLLRLGYGREDKSYAKTYRAVQALAAGEIPETIAARREAHLLLQHHGRTLCRRSAPECPACPLRADCPSAEE